MATPENVTEQTKLVKLEQQIMEIVRREEKRDLGYSEALALMIIRRAAQFFQFCPDDFCMQSARWDEGHVIFGGTNRLHWSITGGFWPSTSHCTSRFLAQFAGEIWEPIGYLDESHNQTWPHITLTASNGSGQIDVPVNYANPHHSILGRKGKDGRIAEVKFYTGTEA